MQIIVKTTTGQSIAIDVHASNTIDNVKAKIQQKWWITKNMQNLVFAGKKLEDQCTLADYGIDNGFRLLLLISPGVKLCIMEPIISWDLMNCPGKSLIVRKVRAGITQCLKSRMHLRRITDLSVL